MKYPIIFIVIIVLFTGCGFQEKGVFADNPILIENFKKEMTLVSELFVDNKTSEFNEFSDIMCLDKYVILSFIDRNEYLFYVYNYERESIGSFVIHKGQGPNDLLTNVYCGQFYVDSTGTYLWINDVNKMKLCAINIDKSLSTGECFIEKTIPSVPMAVNCFYSNDSLLIAERMMPKNYHLLIKNLYSNIIIADKPIYNFPVDDCFSTYKSTWKIKPDGTKYVLAMKSMNQLNIGDLLTDKKIQLNIYNKNPKLEDIVNKESGIEKHSYYIEVETTDKYIYGLYLDQPREDMYVKEKSLEIHVFSWDGDAVCKYIIPQYIESFAVNETEGCILGWDDGNEKLFKYKFNKSFFQ